LSTFNKEPPRAPRPHLTQTLVRAFRVEKRAVERARFKQNHASAAPGADTTPGSHVIFICGQRIVKGHYTAPPLDREIMVIHEMLHSLGLGENPPSSREITKQVTACCGR